MRIDVGEGTRLFVDTVGGSLEPTDDEMLDKPSLVLLHGGPGGDHSGFRPYFDRFADTHQVVYLDHRGNGRSDGWDQPDTWDLDTWADDVVRVCDALDLADPVVLGLSFGGFVAQRYAARHPDHPSKLILMSTAARPPFEVAEAKFRELGGDAAGDAYRKVFVEGDLSAEAVIEYFTVNMPLYNQVPSEFGPSRTIMNLDLLAQFTLEWRSMDLRGDLARIEVPVLVLGGNEDPMTPRESSIEIVEHLVGRAQLELLDRCGHGTFRDQPEQTEALLRAFLAD